MKIKSLLLILTFVCLWSTFAIAEKSSGRYYLEGDGVVKIFNPKNGLGGTVHYRERDGSYSPALTASINRLFGITPGSSETISLRLISLLDYLQENLKGGTIKIVSGYRSPSYNENLRKKGRLAARTSLHIEGMAADIDMEGISGVKLWEYVRDLHCCGAGYYHGKGIHIDTGPDRFWDEKTTKVDQDLGGHNKLILLRTDQDIYRPGETIRFTLNRITDYPISIKPEAALVEEGKEIDHVYLNSSGSSCVAIGDRKSAKALSWQVPKNVDLKEKVKIRISLCNKEFSEMPDNIESNPLSIR